MRTHVRYMYYVLVYIYRVFTTNFPRVFLLNKSLNFTSNIPVKHRTLDYYA